MPSATMVTTSDEPPLETSGNGTPITGRTPMTTPMLISAWPSTHTMTPVVAMTTNGSSARCATRTMPTASATSSSRTDRVPGSPSSSPTMAKMKSLCASGSHAHFSRLAPRPRPHQPPEASAHMPCVGCQHSP